ncbi:copper resistance system multicopper oxidase [Vreelandella titanicae]|jgi:CopA family copper-resistance protein|uniref:Copper resistance system multicopper oxidase n=3 Tax=Halomonadaceae TaxID=28256 RepID=A0A558J0G9_9GAMM|nr:MULTISPECIES: copper resistance system multicopper oxidase [Halomonadaceae]MBL1267745.1 copper resistance system multicopper oxidase [Halomonas sp.]MEA2118734.1 copper resistance system multicopper oxidase [Halovibrio sp. HP20-59]QNU63155.1 copper resistance system multicopper oxidase [Halomonas titanicae]TVU87151.1 copper resistance system multicopper oxidase [Halomonas titanicae]|tara:strand:+ start:187 stop:2040 length:1854 start_codon:yes stop_codon:yes gene_type:complete
MARSSIISHPLSRRQVLKGGAALGLGSAAAMGLTPAWANPWGRTNVYAQGVEEGPEISLAIRRESIPIDGQEAHPISINGTSPGPLIRLKEGQDAVLRVTNLLDESTSIHWHGLILPPEMDGVPGVSFAGIAPGETFTYRFPVRQNGTYWYHSHSGLQEQLGHAGPLIIDAAEREPIRYDREHVLLLTDWTFEDPMSVFRNLKTMEGYYNFQERTIADFFADVREKGFSQTAEMRGMWAKMRMSSRDIADVTGSTYTYLLNGHSPQENWNALFKAGERVRLRVINGSAMSYFDVRIPGLKMTVVAADGQPVQPVPVDEFRIGVAETYDVLVSPEDDRAYTIFAEAMDRSGYARATLAPREGMQAEIPKRRQIADRGMEAMGAHGMGDMEGMDHSGMSNMEGMDHSNMPGMSGDDAGMEGMDHSNMEGMDHSNMEGMDHSNVGGMSGEQAKVGENGILIAGEAQPGSRYDQAGIGIDPNERRVLVYRDLKAFTPWPDRREPGRELELHLTGNMERYMWSFDGKKFSEVTGPIHFVKDERLRLILINDTMMEHPIHLHGMWMELENGQGELIPRKHTLNVKPGERVSALITADAEGSWAFHCHLLYHMDAGMFRVVQVS